MPTYAASKLGYLNLWQEAEVAEKAKAVSAAEKILKSKPRYKAVQDGTGVPWFWVAIIHMRESNNDFLGVLHNGQQIIGKGTKTTLVPAGRGPFSSWEEAAVDAIKLKALDTIDDWPISRVLYEAERYNGWGYVGRINSPYVWAATSLQERGKYTSDGNYDAGHWDTQLGVVAVLKQLMELDLTIAQDLGGNAPGNETVPPEQEATGEAELRAALLELPQVKSIRIEYGN